MKEKKMFKTKEEYMQTKILKEFSYASVNGSDISDYANPPTGCMYDNIGSSCIVCISPGITQGTGNYQRIGNSINVKEFSFGWAPYCKDTVTATDLFNWARVVVFIDRASNGAYPVFSDILQNNSANTSSNFWSQPNVKNSSRFEILYDKVFALTTYNPCPIIEKCFTFDGLQTDYKASNIAVGDVVNNCIYFMVFSALNDAGNDDIYFWHYYFKIKFYDK